MTSIKNAKRTSNEYNFGKLFTKLLVGSTLVGAAVARSSKDIFASPQEHDFLAAGGHEYAGLLNKPMSDATQRALLAVGDEPTPAFPLSVVNNRLT